MKLCGFLWFGSLFWQGIVLNDNIECLLKSKSVEDGGGGGSGRGSWILQGDWARIRLAASCSACPYLHFSCQWGKGGGHALHSP